MLCVCLLINWLCVIVMRRKPKSANNYRLKVNGGRVLMAINNMLLMVQVGYPTGICAVRSFLGNHGQGQRVFKR